ncbi:type I restriction endonuclease subunit R [Streptomyces sp. NPDC102274]|uniref:type I restriction endonuclease subunit R n=1 Tax=Streptomyces sp. NPDC102274 TaxID=3366151 RepID=UPI0037FB6CF6
MAQPEYDKTEKPLIDQLIAMGWEYLQGGPPGGPATEPGASERASFAQVLYKDRFRTAIARINPGPNGRTWLSAAQIDHILAWVQGTAPGQGPAGRGVAGNAEVTSMLREGIPSRTVPGWRRGEPETVRLVDWYGEFTTSADDGDTHGYGGNDLLAVSQFRVERKDFEPTTPDLVLFVNGLPWVVIECKAPSLTQNDSRAALDAAVEQVVGYAGANANASAAELTRFAQVLIGTDRDHAELGTVTAEPEHFAPWRTVRPISDAQVKGEVGKGADVPLTAQEILVAGVLRPAHLLTLVRDFTTFTGRSARTVKVIGRYQQFRAVSTISERLRHRSEAVAAGRDTDQRGGVIWHTQGSGKSLTMAFLVRHLRSDPELAGHKVVVITDRIDLEKQIRKSLGASDETVHRAGSVKGARAYLAVDVPDLVLVMIQKAQRDDTANDGTTESLGDDGANGEEENDADGQQSTGQVIHNRIANPNHDIVVLIDEAHRGHAAWQHARLRAMLPNAVLIGFTGTPIIDKNRRTTEEIFGAFADIYTLRDAERDRSVKPVRYEAYRVSLEVVEKAALDAKFDEKVPSDPEQRTRVLRTFARRKEVLEAPSVIAEKADHMLRHWARSALPDRFGAQIAAASRLAAVRYHEALLDARDRLLERLDALDPQLTYDPLAVVTPEERELLDILPHRDVLASIEAAVVISKAQPGKPKDPDDWKPWTTKTDQDAHIDRFKQGIGDPHAAAADPSWDVDPHGTVSPGWGTGAGTGEVWHEASQPQTSEAPEREASEAASAESGRGETSETADGPMAFLLVQSMLLTGFDAPVEQVLYLDRAMAGAGLLQAVARTNRPYAGKQWGQVVDFVGIGPALARSLAAYDEAHLRQVYGYDTMSVDHLTREDREAPHADRAARESGRAEEPAREGLLLQSDVAAEALLADLARRISEFLALRGLDDIEDLADESRREDLLAALAEPLARGEFDELVRDFLTALNAVLPRPEALDHERAARLLGETQVLARQRYLDGRDQFSPRRYGAKVRQLISQHLEVNGIQQRIPPVELTAPDFLARVNANSDPRARTAYMTSRLRLHITAEIAADRGRYTPFSKRLEEITRRMADDFEKAAADLVGLIQDVNAAERQPDDASGLAPRTEQPIYRLLRQQLVEAGAVESPPGVDFHQAARGLAADIALRVRPPQFLTADDAQDRVRRELRSQLELRLDLDWDDTGPLANLLLELAVERRDDFLGYRAGEGSAGSP